MSGYIIYGINKIFECKKKGKLSMLDMKELFKQTNNDSENYIYITPTTIAMWIIGLFLIIFAAINGFF